MFQDNTTWKPGHVFTFIHESVVWISTELLSKGIQCAWFFFFNHSKSLQSPGWSLIISLNILSIYGTQQHAEEQNNEFHQANEYRLTTLYNCISVWSKKSKYEWNIDWRPFQLILLYARFMCMA